jgi:cellulose synthase/poly-beta-1,6-N-acetylglucosamine synthase-like glycosyltransferase
MSPDWLKTLVAPLTAGPSAACGDFRPLCETPISLGMRMEQIAARGVNHYTGLYGAGGIVLRREIVDRVGEFPENVLVGVDWDLNTRLAMLNVMCIFCPQAVIYTEVPATLKDYWRNEVRWRRAHLASLFRHTSYFLPNLIALTRSLYIYMLAWFTFLTGLGAGIILAFGSNEIRWMAPVLWVTLVAWLFFRRAALAGAVAAYTRQWKWLGLVWVLPVLLSTTLAAIIPATLTLKKSQAHFKGPRHT